MRKISLGSKFYSIFLAACCFVNTAMAADKLLSSLELEQPQAKVKVELWGDKMAGGYNKDFLMLVKDEEGKLITAYKPDINGGYNPYLRQVQLLGPDKEKQVLLAVAEGDWQEPTSYRVLDVTQPEAVQEIFGAQENLGVVNAATLEGNTLKVVLNDGRSYDVALEEKCIPEKIRGNGQLDFQKLHSLTVYSGNSDGKDILISTQQIRAGKSNLADVSAIYYYQEPEKTAAEQEKDAGEQAGNENKKTPAKSSTKDNAQSGLLQQIGDIAEVLLGTASAPAETTAKAQTPAASTGETEKQEQTTTEAEKQAAAAVTQAKAEDKKETAKPELWKISNYAIMSNSSAEKTNSINDGFEFSKAIVLTRRIILGHREATYPLVVCPGKQELEDKINKLITEENKENMERFYSREADVAFNVIRGDQKLFTLQFICGNDHFDHHNLNIDPNTGEKIKLSSIINVKDPDLLPILNLLRTNDKVHFTKVPQEWYLHSGRLFFLQKVEGEDYASSYALKDLRKFLLDKSWLEEN